MKESTVTVERDELKKDEVNRPRLYPDSSLSYPVRDLSNTFSGIDMLRKHYGM